MQHLIASYLFQYGDCPLPGMGHLSIITKPSASDFVNKLMTAPTPVIRFAERELDETALVQFVADRSGASSDGAKDAIHSFCHGLKGNVAKGKEANIDGVGDFTSNSIGELQFKQQEFPAAFTGSVKAERVIHPEATHAMLVGDKETTSTVMSGYYNEEAAKKDAWWIWAIILAAIAFATIALYFNDPGHSSLFGNAVSYKLA